MTKQLQPVPIPAMILRRMLSNKNSPKGEILWKKPKTKWDLSMPTIWQTHHHPHHRNLQHPHQHAWKLTCMYLPCIYMAPFILWRRNFENDLESAISPSVKHTILLWTGSKTSDPSIARLTERWRVSTMSAWTMIAISTAIATNKSHVGVAASFDCTKTDRFRQKKQIVVGVSSGDQNNGIFNNWAILRAG